MSETVFQGTSLAVLAHDDNAIYVRDSQTQLTKLALADGHLAWTLDLGGEVSGCGTTTGKIACAIRDNRRRDALAVISTGDGNVTRTPIADLDAVRSVTAAGDQRWVISTHFLPPVAPLLYTTQKTYTRFRAINEQGQTLKTITLTPGTLQVRPSLFGGSKGWYPLQPEDRYTSFAVSGDTLITSKSLVGWDTESQVSVSGYSLK